MSRIAVFIACQSFWFLLGLSKRPPVAAWRIRGGGFLGFRGGIGRDFRGGPGGERYVGRDCFAGASP